MRNIQRNTVWLVLVLLIASGGAAVASDVEIKVPPAGLAFIAAEVPEHLPAKWTFGDLSYTLGSCPSGSSYVAAKKIEASPTFESLSIEPGSGRLTVRFAARATGEADLVAEKILCVGSVSCKLELELKQGTAVARFTPKMIGGKLRLADASVEIQIGENDVVVNLVGCGGLGTAASSVVNWARSRWIGWAEDKLEEAALEHIPPLVEESLAGFTSVGGAAYPLSFEAEIDRVSTATGGFGVGVQVDVSNTGKASCSLPASPAPPPTTTAPSFSLSNGAHFGLAVSASTIKQVVNAYWKSGELCFASSRLEALGMSMPMVQAGGVLLGMQSVSALSARAPRPPQTSMVQGTDAKLDLLLAGFEATIEGTGPKGATTIDATADIKARITLKLDPISRGVRVDSLSTTVSNVNLTATDGEGLNLSKTLFAGILADVVVPFVEQQLVGMQMLPHVMNQQGGMLAPYYLYLNRSQATSRHVYLYGRLFKRPQSDSGRPATFFETKPPTLLKAGPYRLVAKGSDSLIPEELLRYKWRANGGSWSPVGYSRGKTFDLGNGSHQIEVKAVDLHGNEDQTPAKAQLEVDGVAPAIQVTPAPATLTSPSVRIGFSASDDRTPAAEIKVMMVLKRDGETVREDPFIKGVESLDLLGLSRGEYTVTLVAEDEVGNRSQPGSTTFTVILPETEQPQGPPPASQTVWQPQPDTVPGSISGGCSVAAAGEGHAPWWLLLACLLLGAARRRRV